MRKDDHLIFEAYKNFKTFVNEQDNVDVEKAREAAKGVRKAADKLDKTLQNATAQASETPETSETPQAPVTPETPVQPTTNTARYLPKTAQEYFPQPQQTSPTTPVVTTQVNPGSVTPRAEQPVPVTPNAPSNIYSGKGEQTGTAAAPVQPTTIPVTQYSGKGQNIQTTQTAEDEKLKQDALEREKQLYGQVPTISTPKAVPTQMTTKGRRIDTRRVA